MGSLCQDVVQGAGTSKPSHKKAEDVDEANKTNGNRLMMNCVIFYRIPLNDLFYSSFGRSKLGMRFGRKPLSVIPTTFNVSI